MEKWKCSTEQSTPTETYTHASVEVIENTLFYVDNVTSAIIIFFGVFIHREVYDAENEAFTTYVNVQTEQNREEEKTAK